MTDVFVLPLQKAMPLEDEDGVLTRYGMEVAHDYAAAWVNGQRLVDMERQYPSMVGLFYDIRNDRALASEHAIPMGS